MSAIGQAAPTGAQPPAQTPPQGQPAPQPPPVTPPPVTPPAGQPPVTPPPGQPPVTPPAGQPPVTTPPADQPPVAAPATEAPPVREQRTSGPVVQLTLDETVKRALEFNLDVQVQRLNPRIQDLNVQSAYSVWLPSLTNDTRFNSFSDIALDDLLGTTDITNRTFTTTSGVAQALPWFGTEYSLGWANDRRETNQLRQTFNPTLTSTLTFNMSQPLLRNFMVDADRTQLLVSRKQREITDVQLQQQIIQTTRQVRNQYWELVYARANLGVAQQSLDLSRQTLRDNRTRVEVGTMAPIDIVRAEAEVARNEETAILAAAQIDQQEDNLRRLIFDPSSPDYWTTNIDLTDQAPYPSDAKDVDVEAAVASAMQRRTDLVQLRKSLESNDINIRFYRNQLLPQVDFFANYGLFSRGGLQLDPDDNRIVTGERTWRDTVNSMLDRDAPRWTVGVQVQYPIGRSAQDVNLARARLQYQQSQLNLRDAELQAAAEVRTAGRNVNTNRRRVEASRATRVLSERQLEAEQKKFAVGLSSPFEVVQAQRDLAIARNSELQAIIDYVQSLVDFEAVQLAGTGGANATNPQGGGGGGGAAPSGAGGGQNQGGTGGR